MPPLTALDESLMGCASLRMQMRGLGEWRYRVGDYRMLCTIFDERLVIEVFAIGHRRSVCG